MERYQDQLKYVVWKTTWGGSFTMLVSTGVIWAGTVDLRTSIIPWVAGLAYVLFINILLPAIYLLKRSSSPSWANGVMALLGGSIPAATGLGMAYCYFYFSFAPMPAWVRAAGLVSGTGLMFYWGAKVWGDVMTAMSEEVLFAAAYVEEESAFFYSWGFMIKLEKAQYDRNPFSKTFVCLALAISPFSVILNRVLTPYTGSGAGVFMVLACLGLPMSLWIVGFSVRAFIIMVYFPLKLKQRTGKPVLMRDFAA